MLFSEIKYKSVDKFFNRHIYPMHKKIFIKLYFLIDHINRISNDRENYSSDWHSLPLLFSSHVTDNIIWEFLKRKVFIYLFIYLYYLKVIWQGKLDHL